MILTFNMNNKDANSLAYAQLRSKVQVNSILKIPEVQKKCRGF